SVSRRVVILSSPHTNVSNERKSLLDNSLIITRDHCPVLRLIHLWSQEAHIFHAISIISARGFVFNLYYYVCIPLDTGSCYKAVSAVRVLPLRLYIAIYDV